ncbi:hypothetical protein FHT86_005312 [Rhizobium sp. BK313]|nr:hypothetical protein [Rhizobium sp. BK313]
MSGRSVTGLIRLHRNDLANEMASDRREISNQNAWGPVLLNVMGNGWSRNSHQEKTHTGREYEA